MNPKFYELEIYKQEKFKCAGYKVFGENTYNKASMQTLADEAGVSKALIFHYFRNKMTLYQWLFEEAFKTINVMNDLDLQDNSDFFELIDQVIVKRLDMMKTSRIIYSFIQRVYESSKLDNHEAIFYEIHQLNLKRKQSILSCVDRSKFRNEEDIECLYDLIIDLSNGYYQKMNHEDFSDERVLKPYKAYLNSLRSHYYKEICI